jgi:hypothetical protein
VRVRVQNVGTGRMPVEIAAVRGERFPEADEDAPPSAQPTVDDANVVSAAEPVSSEPDTEKAWRESRTTITLGPGESQEVTVRCPFDPERVMVDPDALVLQLRRKLATVKL